MSDTTQVQALGLLLGACGLVLYFLPTIGAVRMQHRAAASIFVLNLFAGWTIIFWIVALVWSLVPARQDKDAANAALIAAAVTAALAAHDLEKAA